MGIHYTDSDKEITFKEKHKINASETKGSSEDVDFRLVICQPKSMLASTIYSFQTGCL